jgi:phage protein, HK97 gp10 family
MSRRNRSKEGFERGSFSAGGAGKTTKQLEELGEHVIEAAKKALAAGADAIVQEAKGRCPVRKGTLRDSIRAVASKNGARITIKADAKAKDGEYYGQYVEFSPNINRPFLYPAFDAQRDKVKESIIEAIKGAIRQ